MAARSSTLAPPDQANGSRPPTPPSRALTRRRALPGSRAVVGGLLVTTAAVGLFAAYDAASAGPTASYVVATHEIQPGEPIGPDDLELVAIDLPAAQRSVSFTEPGVLVGTVSTARIGEGQLIQSTLVAEALPDDVVQVSVPVEPANAMNGVDLRGRRVDVVVTTTDGGTPAVATVARRVRVADVVTGDANLGNRGQLTVVLEVDPDDAEAVAMAGATGTISLLRVD
jgi:Flp pilus assembly protein CpaB